MHPKTDPETAPATEPRHEWAARNAAYAAAHPVPQQSRVVALALATPVVLLLLTIGWYLVALDAELGDASSQAHQDVVARCVLATLGGLGCLTAGWLTPRGSRAAWLRTAFALTSVLVIPAAMFAGA
ncbi:hypothetical protein [Streptomyces venezuelae]|uniref:Uncharacterized protein n=1 Tax=Streptomyces venezuelae TaxID=54571 RepID=A0A5P2BYV9_STRVZ|nr:hypothetical protein [Streptomyces venezuelae]QES35702.1 hypothetical protein DEJ48_21820 [Streptomyces venezuelae]